MKKFMLFSLIVLFALILAACGGGTTDADTAEEGTGEVQVEEVVTLELWVFEGEEGFLPLLKERFEASHPNILLNITEIPEEDYTVKVDTVLAAGSPPDIGFILDAKWVKAGHMLSIDSLIEEKGIDLDDYNQGAMGGCLFDDSYYCIGSYSGAVLLFYNKDMFDAAGIAYPSTTVAMGVDEYAALAEQLSVASDNLEDRVWGGAAETPIWWTDPRNAFSADGRAVEINDEATVHMYQVLGDMVANGYAPSYSDFDLLGDEDMMAGGFMAMSMIDNLYGVEVLEEAEVNYGAAPVPVEKSGDQGWVSSWTDAFAVFAGSEHPEEAGDFIAWLAVEGNELRLESGALPMNLALAASEDWAGEYPGRQDILEVLSVGHESVFVPSFWDVIDPLWESWDLLVEGEISAQEGLDEAADFMQESLDQAWETWEALDD